MDSNITIRALNIYMNLLVTEKINIWYIKDYLPEFF